jgi:hypothetical protein
MLISLSCLLRKSVVEAHANQGGCWQHTDQLPLCCAASPAL